MNVIEDEVLAQLTEQVEGESPAAYRAFLFYARLDENERQPDVSVPKVAQYAGLSENTVKSYRTNYNWEERASLIATYLLKLDFEDRRAEMKKDSQKYVQANRALKEKTIKASKQMLETALNVLNEYKDMRPKLSDVPPLVNAAVKAHRLALELPTDIVETKLPATAQIQGMDYNELDTLQEQINKERRLLEQQNKIIEVSDQ